MRMVELLHVVCSAAEGKICDTVTGCQDSAECNVVTESSSRSSRVLAAVRHALHSQASWRNFSARESSFLESSFSTTLHVFTATSCCSPLCEGSKRHIFHQHRLHSFYFTNDLTGQSCTVLSMATAYSYHTRRPFLRHRLIALKYCRNTVTFLPAE